MSKPCAHSLALAGALALASLAACKRDEALSSAPAASASASGAPSSVTPVAFCAFLEDRIVDELTRADKKGELSTPVKRAKAQVMNGGCERSIGAGAAKDPAGWQRCATCLMEKKSLSEMQACDAICRSFGLGGAPASSGSASR